MARKKYRTYDILINSDNYVFPTSKEIKELIKELMIKKGEPHPDISCHQYHYED